MNKKSLLFIVLITTSVAKVLACTSFGFLTNIGTVIAKNSDYYYDKQSVEVLVPNKQFAIWYNNPYNNNFKVFAQMANNNVKMGINEVGLTAMEEDPILVKNPNQRRYIQPIGGTAECMTLWGILQNFKTVDQVLTYLNAIFSHASPNYYEVADAHKILIVEVAFSTNDTDTTRKFSYRVLSKTGDSYTHTNIYQDARFINLNRLSVNPYATQGAEARNTRIKELLSTSDRSESNVLSWFLDTKSSVRNPKDNKWCLATSLFNSYLGQNTKVDTAILHSDAIGTVASMFVFNNSTPQQTKVIVRLVNKITTDAKGNQTIFYNETKLHLADLFVGHYTFTEKKFTRLAPINGICE
ncbi:MAG: hypothetical protein K0R14_2179 [Burkholderiales bacterium]|jgi:hypothetical protein|nr:hypothetical protein [Burkholderiales bacterium]